MARVESLGVHTPVSLPYLIREGILPLDPRRDLYKWKTYVFNDEEEALEEEILTTKTAVAWSQGSFIRNIYRFQLEGEDVADAVLTSFPIPSRNVSPESRHKDEPAGTERPAQRTSTWAVGQGRKTASPKTAEASTNTILERALVVLLRTKAHIYFINGSWHIVDLPFEIAAVYPALKGVIFERKAPTPVTVPPTPQIPVAPPNSFFSSQPQPGSSNLFSPTISVSYTNTQPSKPSPLGGIDTKLEALYNGIVQSTSKVDESDDPLLYSLTDPFSDLGVVSFTVQNHKPRPSSKGLLANDVEFEPLPAGERVVYVSPVDETYSRYERSHTSLMLLVTMNDDLQVLTVWHAWYISERALNSLLKQRAASKAAKLRRRSSFLSASIGTGATTPLVRQRDQVRESFPVGGRRLAGELATTQTTGVASRQRSRKDEEDAMASQMDPDYARLSSQQPLRENRRISSMNTELRSTQNITGSSFTITSNRRYTSFGGHNERRSLSSRKSRASTPGSAYAHSVGPEDDAMEIDNVLRNDSDEDVDEVLRHMRAANDAIGTDNVFGCADDVFKRELVVKKLHALPMSSRRSATEPRDPPPRVVTLKQTEKTASSKGTRLNVYIHDQKSHDLTCLQLLVKQRPRSSDMPMSTQVAVPIVIAEYDLGKCSDIVKLIDGDVAAVLLQGRGVLLSIDNSDPLPLVLNEPYRAYNPLGILSPHIAVDKDIGRNRTLDGPDKPVSLSRAGLCGSFDVVGSDGTHHRRRIQFRPYSSRVDDLLGVCQYVLPRTQASAIRRLWCVAHVWLLQHPQSLTGTSCGAEWVALVATVLMHGIHLLDPETRAALKVASLAGSRRESGAGKEQPGHTTWHIRRRRLSSVWTCTNLQQSIQSFNPPLQPRDNRAQNERRKDQLLPVAAAIANELLSSASVNKTLEEGSFEPSLKLMLGLHVRREEARLSTFSLHDNPSESLSPVIAQLGYWLGLQAWGPESNTYSKHDDTDFKQWAYVKTKAGHISPTDFTDEPEEVFLWLELVLKHNVWQRYPTLADIAGFSSDPTSKVAVQSAIASGRPQLEALSDVLATTKGFLARPEVMVEAMSKHGMRADMLQILSDAFANPLKEAIARCERAPPTTWSKTLHELIGREDLDLGGIQAVLSVSGSHTALTASPRDLLTVCGALEHQVHLGKTKEAGRHAVSQLIFGEDRRLVDAFNLMHFNGIQTAECPKQPHWGDATHFEQQRKVMQFVTLRMIALPVGDGLIHFDSQSPLLTEKYYLPGFNSSCLMQPMGHTLTTERTGLTEEKVNWAYFHAGVAAGLRISRNVKGIDTSWVAFNKPAELTNRYAGLLLALGLNGHLRSLAKWLSFKYLTPKHNMTSVGLLLGLSASYMGTMDSLITRMLSVHITRMLPAGAAELNVSSVTQTAGLMGIGLLYFNTQHRRMSEIMVCEIEHLEVDDPDGGLDQLRDESYRLAAGLALGFINVGKGGTLRGLHGLQLPERLLAIAVGPRPVNAVHVFDRATAGAIIALVLIYMKTGNQAIARKLDIPDTEPQYDHVRPDMLVLRAMAKHLVLWDSIKVTGGQKSQEPTWIKNNLPLCYRNKFQDMAAQPGRITLKTLDVPFYNIVTGLAWALSLRYAGSANEHARDEILAVLDNFNAVKGSEVYYYDAKLARSIIRRCIDMLALSAATIMAGTGDLKTFRYLRRLHGRTDAETPYGSHMAAHLGIGVLFLGGGTYTLGTSDLATASLICAFYPLFPTDVHDNRVHLQAFRHFWVFAAEARCLVIEDVDTRRPLAMPVCVTLRDGDIKQLQAPCILPELSTIATIQTTDPAFWRITLDFASNPKHLVAFKLNQRIFVRRCPAAEGHTSTFSTMVAALNDVQRTKAASAQLWHTIFNLTAFSDFNKADAELVLPSDVHSAVHTDERRTVIDERLMLSKAAGSANRNALWNLRLLFSWAERARDNGDETLRWIGNEVIDALKAKVEERARCIEEQRSW